MGIALLLFLLPVFKALQRKRAAGKASEGGSHG
jgi:hypothetical protein